MPKFIKMYRSNFMIDDITTSEQEHYDTSIIEMQHILRSQSNNNLIVETKVNSLIKSNTEIINDNDIDLESNIINISQYNKLKNIVLRTMLKTHENHFANEWQMLDSVLDQQWENFSIFGFELNDTSLAKKAIALLTAFFMAAHIKTELNI